MENHQWMPIPWADGDPSDPPPPKAMLSLLQAGDMALKTMPNPRVVAAVGDLFPLGRFVYLHQDHTRIVRVAEKDEEISGMPGDGLVTAIPAAVLGVTVADCLPIFLWDPFKGVFGVLHSGWKGTGILHAALDILFERFGCAPENLNVTLGPCIGSCCYAVSEERARGFKGSFGENSAIFRNGVWFIDLKAANEEILRKAGVPRVVTMPHCTVCGDNFGSYRKQGKDDFTRMLALVGLTRKKDEK